MPVELPLDDEEASTDVDLKTQLIRFVVTGGVSAVLDLGVTWLFQFIIGAPYTVAKALGFICGTTLAYMINRRWTFRAPPSRARFFAVVALYGVTFAVNVGLYAMLSQQLPSPGGSMELAYSLLAFVIAQGVATVINFVVQRTVIFKIR